MKVHQLMHGFLQGDTAETCIKTKYRKQYGQLEYLSLLDNYGGKFNKAVRIKEAEVLRTLLIYKNDRAMSFDKFLTNMQTTFTGFSENGEILNDLQKILLLFQKV